MSEVYIMTFNIRPMKRLNIEQGSKTVIRHDMGVGVTTLWRRTILLLSTRLLKTSR